jgi:hypothetical protein
VIESEKVITKCKGKQKSCKMKAKPTKKLIMSTKGLKFVGVADKQRNGLAQSRRAARKN